MSGLDRGRFSQVRKDAVEAGYRSAFEQGIAAQLDLAKVQYKYEAQRFAYVTPAAKHHYKPDFVLANGIIIEAKGLFTADDRRKHLLVRHQHPTLDIRFVFQNANGKLLKGGKLTNGIWAANNGFKFSHKIIPAEWLEEISP